FCWSAIRWPRDMPLQRSSSESRPVMRASSPSIAASRNWLASSPFRARNALASVIPETDAPADIETPGSITDGGSLGCAPRHIAEADVASWRQSGTKLEVSLVLQLSRAQPARRATRTAPPTHAPVADRQPHPVNPATFAPHAPEENFQ